MEHQSGRSTRSIKTYITSSIRNKGVAAFLLPLLVIVIFISVYYPARQRQLSLQTTETQVRTLAEMLAFSVGAGLHDSNFDLVQTAFGWIKKDTHVVYTAIIDENDSPLFEHNPVSMKIDLNAVTSFAYDEANSRFQTSQPIEYKGKNFGRIVMVYSLSQVMQEIRTGLIVSVFVGLGILIAGSLLIILIFQKLSSGVIHLREVAQRASEGELNIAVKFDSADEVGDLARAFGKMLQNIGELIRGVSEASAAVANASTEISSSTEEMAAGTQEQSSQAANVAAAVEEMSKTLIENNSNIRTAADVANHAKEDALRGGEVVQHTIEGMHRISSVVNQSAQQVKVLGTSSDKIGEIISVIDDIADQTNLLALNAAIEAARAGEQGRGFAVVADEVRKLAERTSKATKEIADMIRQIQLDTSHAVTSMEKGTEEVANGIVLAEKAGEVLGGIVTMAQSVSEKMSQIAAASAQHSSAAEDISKNLESINTVTHQAADGTQQIARAAEDLSRLTVDLQEMINRFTLEGGTRSQREQTRWESGTEFSGKAVAPHGRLVDVV